MANKGRSEPNITGGYTHYDEKGKKTGYSSPNIFGGYTNYDANGKKTGSVSPGIFGGYTHYDASGKKTGTSSPNITGGYTHYDAKGKKTGSSSPKILGGYTHGSSEGCYIATCVYGSYDCAPVMTLRRFRDGFLKKHFLGKAFIKIYYAVSPKLVAVFGNAKPVKMAWKAFLDRAVAFLDKRGY